MPIVNASDGEDFHIFTPFANVYYQVSVNPVEAIIAGNITSLEELSRHAPQVVSWLKQNLALAHTDENIKNTIKAVLGAPRFTSNLVYFGLWEDLIENCKRQALEIGQGMKRYYDTHELSVVLGEKAIPNTFAKFQLRAGENQFAVERCSQEECARCQDGGDGYRSDVPRDCSEDLRGLPWKFQRDGNQGVRTHEKQMHLEGGSLLRSIPKVFTRQK
jgi:hypothetical protein